jgi:hypothetical protein
MSHTTPYYDTTMQLTPTSSLDFDWLDTMQALILIGTAAVDEPHHSILYHSANPYLQSGFWLVDSM